MGSRLISVPVLLTRRDLRTRGFCGEVELVGQVHTLVVLSAQQVAYELQVREEVERVRQEVLQVKGENKVERESLTSSAHVDEMDDKNQTYDLSHGECARNVTLCLKTKRNGTMCIHTQVFVLSMWKSVIMFMSSLVSALCSVTTHGPNYQLVVRLYNLSSLLPVVIFCTLLHRENTSFEKLCLHLPSVTVDRRQLQTIHL